MHEMRSGPLAYAHEALVLDDPSKPSRKGPTSPILHEVLKSLPESILHLIFGVASIPQHEDRPPEARVVVPRHQLAERVRITAKGSLNQFVIT
jgi:hypothetical protein